MGALTVSKLNETIKMTTRRAETLVPNPKDLARIQSGFLTAFETTPELRDCTETSIIKAYLDCCHLGLVPGPLGECGIVPKGKRALMWPEYKGLIRLAKEAGDVEDVYGEPVYEKDDLEIVNGMADHRYDAKGDRGKLAGYYCQIIRTNGLRPLANYMTVQVIEEHAAKYSDTYKAGKASPWKKVGESGVSRDKMALKVVFRSMTQWISYRPLQKAMRYYEQQEATGEAPRMFEQAQDPDAVTPQLEDAPTSTLDELASVTVTGEPEAGPPMDEPEPATTPKAKRARQAHAAAMELLQEDDETNRRRRLIRCFCQCVGAKGEGHWSDQTPAIQTQAIAKMKSSEADAITTEFMEQEKASGGQADLGLEDGST